MHTLITPITVRSFQVLSPTNLALSAVIPYPSTSVWSQSARPKSRLSAEVKRFTFDCQKTPIFAIVYSLSLNRWHRRGRPGLFSFTTYY
jgi:hypothetical protein